MKLLPLLSLTLAIVPAPLLAQGGTTPPANEKAKEKDIDETVKDYQKMPGLFTIYRNKKGTSDSVLMEVRQDQLGKWALVQSTASTGTVGTPTVVFHGQPINDQPFRIQIVDEGRVVFMQPNLQYRAPRDKATALTMQRSMPEQAIFTGDIKARQDSRKSFLIDITDWLKSDFADIAPNLSAGPQGYSLDPRPTYIDSVKVLPENMVVRTMYRLAWRGAGSAPKSVPFAVNYNFSMLPENGYKPRLADTRIGYFTTSFFDLSDAGDYDNVKNYVMRWNLEKADPNADLSPPKQQIVWWLDDAIPAKYREACREGILMWNAAFEKIGIKDAIVVKDRPADADWDIADIRYNTFRWTVNLPFAIALFRADPFTGQILNASINFDAAFADNFSYDKYVPGTMHGEEVHYVMNPKYKEQCCEHLREKQENFQFGVMAAEMINEVAGIPFKRDDMVHQYIREVAAHEFGHCLGLRHNFVASTQFDGKQLANKDLVAKHGIVATVMEYAPLNIFALKNPGVDFYSRLPGAYDMWAIEYGYAPVKSDTPEGELFALRQIAAKGVEKGFWFETDDMANSYDPYVYRFDLGKEPLEYFAKNLQVSRYLMMNLGKRYPKNGESYYEFTRFFTSFGSTYTSNALNAIRYIGGIRVSNTFKGDPGGRLPVVPIDGNKQKEALGLLSTYLFAENAFNFPKSYYAMLAGDPNSPDSQPNAQDRETPIFSTFTGAQSAALNQLFQPARLNRIANNEFRSAKASDTLTMATLFRTVGNDVWSELSTGHEISQLRRQLQREHLTKMINLVLERPANTPDDAVTLAHEQLRSLRGRIASAMPKARGEYGKAHLSESLMRIDRALKADVSAKDGT